MKLSDLSQLYFLRREIQADERRLKKLEQEVYVAGAMRYSGMPGKATKSGSAIETAAIELVQLRDAIAEKRLQCIREEKRLQQYINGIGDSETRVIFTLRFREGLSWEQIAARLGAGHTAARVKMVCYRYLKRH